MKTLTPRVNYFVPQSNRVIHWQDELTNVALNPQGNYCAYVDPIKNRLCIFPVEQSSKQLKSYPLNELLNDGLVILEITWGFNNELLVEVGKKSPQHQKLFEATQVWSLDQKTGAWARITPESVLFGYIERLSSKFPNEVMISQFIQNKEEPEKSETHLVRYNLSTKSSRVVQKMSEHFSWFVIDEDFRLRFVGKRTLETHRKEIELLQWNEGSWSSIFSATSTEAEPVSIEGYSSDYSQVYIIDGRGNSPKSNYTRAFVLDVEDNTKQMLHAIPGKDIRAIIFSDLIYDCGDVVGFVTEVDKPRIENASPPLDKLKPFFHRINWAQPLSCCISDDFSKLVLPTESNPFEFGIHCLTTGELVDRFELTSPKIHLWQKPSIMYPGQVKGFDDLDINYYVSLPHEHKQGESCPFVVNIHGGPWARDKLRYREL